jgi:hypothetical protein
MRHAYAFSLVMQVETVTKVMDGYGELTLSIARCESSA